MHYMFRRKGGNMMRAIFIIDVCNHGRVQRIMTIHFLVRIWIVYISPFLEYPVPKEDSRFFYGDPTSEAITASFLCAVP